MSSSDIFLFLLSLTLMLDVCLGSLFIILILALARVFDYIQYFYLIIITIENERDTKHFEVVKYVHMQK